PACPLLDEPNHARSDPSALQTSSNIDVNQLQRLASIFDRHATDEAAVELGHPDLLFTHEIRLLPRGGQPLGVTEDRLGLWCAEADVLFWAYRRIRDHHDRRDVVPVRPANSNSGGGCGHRPSIDVLHLFFRSRGCIETGPA